MTTVSNKLQLAPSLKLCWDEEVPCLPGLDPVTDFIQNDLQ